MKSHLFKSVIVLWLLGLDSSPAMAQDTAAADALFNRGLADMQASRYDTGCVLIAESQKLDPRPGTQFTLAECLAKAGKVASAVAAYDDYLRMVRSLFDAQRAKYLERTKIAEQQRGSLAPNVPELTLVLPADAGEDVRVRRDGIDVARAVIGLALPVDPGEHVVVVEVPGQPPIEHRFTVQLGEKKRLEISLSSATVRTTPMVEKQVDKPIPLPVKVIPTGDSRGRTVGMFVAGGLGLAGLATGAVTGGLALQQASIRDAHCVDLECDAPGFAAAEKSRSLSTASTVGFVVGGAGVATAVILLLTRPAEKKDRASVRLDVLDVGQRGVLVGFRGVFQ